ncbi:transcription repressor NadR [Streptococcus sp.]|uniref:transcription repressor NadR n=1 Tax=Streptococcus sp. TaxID=1306 RepID=UPI00359FC9C1
MKANQRRQEILDRLKQASQPISASQLAAQFEVSRQVIVGDVALLRASNHDILSTPKGYCLAKEQTNHSFKGRLVCSHRPEDTEDELLLILDKGGMVLDVEIEHPVYGMLTAALNLKTKEDVVDFMKKMHSSQAQLLSSLTQGIHLHTISCPSSHVFEEIRQALTSRGYLYRQD